MKISKSHFVITGGNRGIGWAVAEMAAANGAHLHIVARSWNEELSDRLTKLGASSVRFLLADLSSREGVEKLVQDLSTVEVDFLFNNAGQLTGGLIEEQNLDEIYSMFQVNVNAAVHLSRAVIPGMVKRGQGKIINNASVSAFMHFPCASTYAASKAALVAFTNCIEMELAGTGVSTLCLVTPGIKTRMFDQIEEKYAKNFEAPQESITPAEYAEKIKAAIENDQTYLLPSGVTGIALWMSKYTSPVFKKIVSSKFRRN